MIPTQYTYGGIPTESTPALQSMLQSSLNLQLLPGTGLNLSPQLGQPFIPSAPQGINSINALLPLIYTAGVAPNPQLSGFGLVSNPLSLNILNSLACFHPVTLCQSVEHAKVNIPLVANEGSNDSAAHTIIRAPVLYKNSDSTTVSTTSSSAGQSPPDRIVASYAVAAHAAALANHQPVSKAAEAFLSATTSTTRSRANKRHRPQLSNHIASIAASPAVREPTSQSDVAPQSAFSGAESASERRAGWSRVVDKVAGTVTYISPDGTQLRDKDQVYSYFRLAYPYLADKVVYKELIESCFVFSPSSTAPMLESDFSLLAVLQPTKALPTAGRNLSIGTATSSLLSTTTSGQWSSVSEESRNAEPDMTVFIKPPENPCRISFNPNVVSTATLDSAKRRRLSGSTDPSTSATNSAGAPEIQQTPVVSSELASTDSSSRENDSRVASLSSITMTDTTTSVILSISNGVDKELSETVSTAVGDAFSSVAELSRLEATNNTLEGVTTTIKAETCDLTGISTPSATIADGTDLPAITSLGTLTCSTPQDDAVPPLLTAMQTDPIPTELGTDSHMTKMTTETFTTAALNQLIPYASTSCSSDNHEQHQSVCLPDQLANLTAITQLLTNSRLAHQQRQQQMATAILSMMAAGRGAPTNPTATVNPQMLAAQPQLVLGGAPVNYGSAAGWLPAHLPMNWPAELSSVAALQQQQLMAAALLQQQQQQHPQVASNILQNLAFIQQQQQRQQQLQQQLAMLTPQSPVVSLGQLQSYLSVLQQQQHQQYAPK